MSPTSGSLSDFKRAFTRVPGLIHLNNAGLAPISKPAADAVRHWVDRLEREGMHCNDDYLAAIEVSRGSLATLIGCSPDEVAFFQSTAGAISQVAFGIGLKPQEEVLTWDQEYASNLYPWKAACDQTGAKLICLPSAADYATPAEQLINAITDKTRVIAISWVQFQTGAVEDLLAIAAAARARKIWTVVDIVQGLGQLPFNFKTLGLDAVCGGSHKWLTSPVGVGYLAIRKERISELRPISVGAATYGTCEDLADFACTLKTTAARFEPGSKATLDIIALGESCRLIRETTVDVLHAEINRLAMNLTDGLTSRGFTTLPRSADKSGGIVSLSLTNHPAHMPTLEKKLRDSHISFARRGPGLRFSPHAFNDDTDIEATLAVFTNH